MGTIKRGRGASLEKYSLCGGAGPSRPGPGQRDAGSRPRRPRAQPGAPRHLEGARPGAPAPPPRWATRAARARRAPPADPPGPGPSGRPRVRAELCGPAPRVCGVPGEGRPAPRRLPGGPPAALDTRTGPRPTPARGRPPPRGARVPPGMPVTPVPAGPVPAGPGFTHWRTHVSFRGAGERGARAGGRAGTGARSAPRGRYLPAHQRGDLRCTHGHRTPTRSDTQNAYKAAGFGEAHKQQSELSECAEAQEGRRDLECGQAGWGPSVPGSQYVEIKSTALGGGSGLRHPGSPLQPLAGVTPTLTRPLRAPAGQKRPAALHTVALRRCPALGSGRQLRALAPRSARPRPLGAPPPPPPGEFAPLRLPGTRVAGRLHLYSPPPGLTLARAPGGGFGGSARRGPPPPDPGAAAGRPPAARGLPGAAPGPARSLCLGAPTPGRLPTRPPPAGASEPGRRAACTCRPVPCAGLARLARSSPRPFIRGGRGPEGGSARLPASPAPKCRRIRLVGFRPGRAAVGAPGPGTGCAPGRRAGRGLQSRWGGRVPAPARPSREGKASNSGPPGPAVLPSAGNGEISVFCFLGGEANPSSPESGPSGGGLRAPAGTPRGDSFVSPRLREPGGTTGRRPPLPGRGDKLRANCVQRNGFGSCGATRPEHRVAARESLFQREEGGRSLRRFQLWSRTSKNRTQQVHRRQAAWRRGPRGGELQSSPVGAAAAAVPGLSSRLSLGSGDQAGGWSPGGGGVPAAAPAPAAGRALRGAQAPPSWSSSERGRPRAASAPRLGARSENSAVPRPAQELPSRPGLPRAGRPPPGLGAQAEARSPVLLPPRRDAAGGVRCGSPGARAGARLNAPFGSSVRRFSGRPSDRGPSPRLPSIRWGPGRPPVGPRAPSPGSSPAERGVVPSPRRLREAPSRPPAPRRGSPTRGSRIVRSRRGARRRGGGAAGRRSRLRLPNYRLSIPPPLPPARTPARPGPDPPGAPARREGAGRGLVRGVPSRTCPGAPDAFGPARSRPPSEPPPRVRPAGRRKGAPRAHGTRGPAAPEARGERRPVARGTKRRPPRLAGAAAGTRGDGRTRSARGAALRRRRSGLPGPGPGRSARWSAKATPAEDDPPPEPPPARPRARRPAARGPAGAAQPGLPRAGEGAPGPRGPRFMSVRASAAGARAAGAAEGPEPGAPEAEARAAPRPCSGSPRPRTPRGAARPKPAPAPPLRLPPSSPAPRA
ncbi:collagen alpha-1(III) chain-like [Perognathus longimembris pacificus]|uniref:collagen alpha-1(III) chain-like n=1 Tax=Perognathus longimembris pacificus TaxID=214514 RepID=UPI002019D978|nr:collagen alpha-1(III) chain-like [Perognathus longimembris pacificus]